MMHAHDVRTCMDATNTLDTRRKILILEQDEYLASLMHLLLYREGFAITAITDVEQLPPQIQSNTAPMILFVSHHWLRDNKALVLNIINENPLWQRVPLIMLMNYYDLDLIERVTELGVTDYLLQPFEPVALLDMIQKYTPGITLN
jgi:response regulator RpfG family c-di-GMP phosphodiesterase